MMTQTRYKFGVILQRASHWIHYRLFKCWSPLSQKTQPQWVSGEINYEASRSLKEQPRAIRREPERTASQESAQKNTMTCSPLQTRAHDSLDSTFESQHAHHMYLLTARIDTKRFFFPRLHTQ